MTNYSKEHFRKPGIYIGLTEDEYFEGEDFGSSSVKAILPDPEDWWWNSQFNTIGLDKKADEDTPDKLFGKALHKAVLEGLPAYEAEYAVEFDGSAYPKGLYKNSHFADLIQKHNEDNYNPDALETVTEIKDALKAMGLPVTGNKAQVTERLGEASPSTPLCIPKLPLSGDKLTLIARARAAGLLEGMQVLPELQAEYEAGLPEGITQIPSVWDKRIRLMVRVLQHDPKSKALLSGGVAEVSVFYRDQETGVPCRARFDYLRPDGICDLKKFSCFQSRSATATVKRQILSYRYDLQRAHYLQARLAMEGLPIHGGTKQERDIVTKAANASKHTPGDFDLKFLFIKSNGAPLVRIVNTEVTSLTAFRQRGMALAQWRLFYETYGLDKMWLTQSQDIYLGEEDLPFAYGVD